MIVRGLHYLSTLGILAFTPTRGVHAAYPTRSDGKPLILAHRGASKIAPENTIAAFKKAVELGVDGVELDVMMSGDNIPVVIHDDRVDRTTNSTGLVWDFTAVELGQMDARMGHAIPVEGVPTLDAVLRVFPDNFVVNVELKHPGKLSEDAFIESVEDVLQKHRSRLRFILSSFDLGILKAVRGKGLTDPLGLLLSGDAVDFKTLSHIQPDGLHLNDRMISLRLASYFSKRKLPVVIWTVDDPKRMERWKSHSVAGVITNKLFP